MVYIWSIFVTIFAVTSSLINETNANHSKSKNHQKLFKRICAMSTTEDGLRVISDCVDEHAPEISKKIMKACKTEVFADESNSEIMNKLCTNYDVMMKYVKCHFEEKHRLKSEKHPESRTAEDRKDFREQRKRVKKCIMTSGGYRR